jgi:hypothetical protein
MNWIKSNPFISGLVGTTVLLCGIMYVLASRWGSQYEEAKISFDEAFQGVTSAENMPLYPVADLRDGKSKALDIYREAIADLTKLFDKYRPKDIENIASQAFTDRLLDANEEVTEAFGDTVLPENFFLGFESYKTTLAKPEATGVLLQQMEGIKNALLGLAKSRPSTLIKVFREPVIEEKEKEEGESNVYLPAPNDIARFYSYEVTFKGSEKSVRNFLTSLGATDSHYFIIRTLHIVNERDTPPQVSDAKFETSDAKEAKATPDDPFGGTFFVLPEAQENPDGEEPSAPTDEIAPDKANADATAPAVDNSRILAQVLGNEEAIVFVRFDIAILLPSQELPKP